MTAVTLLKLLTVEETAAMLGVVPHTLAVWRCNKRYNLPYVKCGSRVRYRPTDVEAFIASNRQTMAEAA